MIFNHDDTSTNLRLNSILFFPFLGFVYLQFCQVRSFSVSQPKLMQKKTQMRYSKTNVSAPQQPVVVAAVVVCVLRENIVNSFPIQKWFANHFCAYKSIYLVVARTQAQQRFRKFIHWRAKYGSERLHLCVYLSMCIWYADPEIRIFSLGVCVCVCELLFVG